MSGEGRPYGAIEIVGGEEPGMGGGMIDPSSPPSAYPGNNHRQSYAAPAAGEEENLSKRFPRKASWKQVDVTLKFIIGQRVVITLPAEENRPQHLAGGHITEIKSQNNLKIHIFGFDQSLDKWYDPDKTEIDIVKDPQNILVWDEKQTGRWLTDIGLRNYAQIFVLNGYCGWKLKIINQTDLFHMDMIQGDINTLLQKRDIELDKYELSPPEGVAFMPWLFDFLEDSACELDVPVNVKQGVNNFSEKVREQVSLRTMVLFTALFFLFAIIGLIFNHTRGNYSWKGYTSNILIILLLGIGLYGGDSDSEIKERKTKLTLLSLYFVGMSIAFVLGVCTGLYYLTKVDDKIDKWCENDKEGECDSDEVVNYNRVGYVMAISCIFTFIAVMMHVLRVIARATERVLVVSQAEGEDIPVNLNSIAYQIKGFSNYIKAKLRLGSKAAKSHAACAGVLAFFIVPPLLFIFCFVLAFAIFFAPFYLVHKCFVEPSCSHGGEDAEAGCSIHTNWRCYLIYWLCMMVGPMIITNLFFNGYVCGLDTTAGVGACAMWNIMWEAFF